MRQRGCGRIAFTSSIAALTGGMGPRTGFSDPGRAAGHAERGGRPGHGCPAQRLRNQPDHQARRRAVPAL